MGVFSRFERSVENGIEGAANKMFDAPISPVQISKRAEKAMRHEKMVGSGVQYAPTLYTVLVNPEDDRRLFGYYPTLAGETETYLAARAVEEGLTMDGQPLVRFIVDEGLKRGKFDIIAELVSAPIVERLRREEMQRYGLAPRNSSAFRQQGAAQAATGAAAQAQAAAPQSAAHGRPATQAAPAAAQQTQQQEQPYQHNAYLQRLAASQAGAPSQEDLAAGEPEPEPARKQALPYVPEEEIDRSIDYGEYTFNSQDFEDYSEHGVSAQQADMQAARERYARRDSQPLPRVDGAPYEQYGQYDPYEDPQFQEISYSRDDDLSGLDVEAWDPYTNNSHDLDAPIRAAGNNGAPAQIANTLVFAPAAAQANRTPGQAAGGAARARLVNTSTNRTIDLAANSLVLGRSSASDIAIDDINVSRTHAQLRFEPQGTWTITDLGSTNGTKVNGQRIVSQTLGTGDRVMLGMTEFVFVVG